MSRPCKRVLLWIALPPALFLLVVALFLVEERIRGKIALRDTLRQLKQKGEDVSIPKPAGETNAFVTLLEGLSKGSSVELPPYMTLTSNGTAVAGHRKVSWGEGGTNTWESLERTVKEQESKLETARKLLAQPVSSHVDLSDGYNLKFTHLSGSRRLAQLFAAQAFLALHRGETHQAASNLVHELPIATALEGDRLIISELVRIAIGAMARSHTWEALQADGWSDDSLAALAVAWEKVGFIHSIRHGFAGERQFEMASSDALRKSNAEAVKVLFWMDDNPGFLMDEEPPELSWEQRLWRGLRNQAYVRAWRFSWLDMNEANYLRKSQELIEISRSAVTNRSYKAAEPRIDQVTEETLTTGWYDRLRSPGPDSISTLARLPRRAMQTETERSLILAAIALKRHFIKHSRYPESLEAMVPELLSIVPIDYMDGQPIRYRLGDNTSFLLYSVGTNCKDNNGDGTVESDESHGRGWWTRKDTVWPGLAVDNSLAEFETLK